MRFPGSRYPGGNAGPPAQNTPKVYGPTETLTGTLRQISSTDLVIDAGDDRIVLVQIQSGTKYSSTMGKVKAADFEPGDHVTVEATRDDSDHYYSKTITMNKKGTAEEKAAALKAADSSAVPGGNGAGADDSDPDRPRLHRSNPDAAASPGEQSAGSASAPAASGSGTLPSGGSQSPSNPASGSRAAAAQPAPSPVAAADDSGPPVLRRSSAPAASSPPQTASAAERPSLSAEDVNGVTRPPVVAPSAPADADRVVPDRDSRNPDVLAGGGPGGDPVIDQAREAAFSFSETLPNYVVKQYTNRYQTGSARGGSTSWQPLDIVTTDLIYEDGKERYTNVMVNGKPTKYIEQTGSWSEGEFASMLQAILAPGTNADFRNQRQVTFANRASYKYDYTVEQPRSTWTLHADGQTYKPSYTGSIWIDKATYRVLRIEIAARNLPRGFPLDTAESSIDYDFVMIGDQKVLLPAHAESLSCVRGTPDCTRNTTDFRNYKKYGAETNITFEGQADK